MLKNIIILVVIIIGGYMVYTNYMQNEEIAALDGVDKEEHPGKINPDDLVSD
jgi:hypothetical protein